MRYSLTFLLSVFICCQSMAATPIDKIAAQVNDQIITESELKAQLKVVEAQLQRSQTAKPSAAVLKNQVLNHLIDVELQLQLAKQNNIEVSNTDINQALDKIAARNHLDKDGLLSLVSQQGIDSKSYRENLRKEMTVARVQQTALAGQVVVTDHQLAEFIKNNQNRLNAKKLYHVATMLIPLPEVPAPTQVKAAKIKAKAILEKVNAGTAFEKLAVAESGDSFALEGGDLGWRSLAALPTPFASRLPGMKPGDVSEAIRTGNGFHIIKLIETKSDKQKHEVTLTKARHILLKTDALNTPKVVERKLQKIRDNILNKKTTFNDAAQANSEDIGSAEKGGDLGWVHPGQTVPQFEKAMQALQAGEISKPIKSTFGYHLIQVINRKVIDDTENFEKQQIRTQLYQQKFSEQVNNWVRELRAKAYVKIHA